MTSETLLNSIHQLEIQEITDMVNHGAERAVKRIKPYADFPEPVFLAIDATYVAYYGDRDEMDWVSGAPKDKGYDWCHKFATAAIVGENVHMVVGMIPIGNSKARNGNAYPGESDRSYRVGEIVRELMAMATDHLRIKCVYADREFEAADTIVALEQENVKYMIPAPRNSRTKKWMDENVDVEQGILGGCWQLKLGIPFSKSPAFATTVYRFPIVSYGLSTRAKQFSRVGLQQSLTR